MQLPLYTYPFCGGSTGSFSTFSFLLLYAKVEAYNMVPASELQLINSICAALFEPYQVHKLAQFLLAS